ncbi:MAG: tetratricopeptide repeat protein [Steroidobacteraceae bacterium]
MAPETPRERGMALHRAGRLAEAEAIYADLLRRDPDDVEVLQLRGAVLRELRRPTEALAAATAAIARRPSSAAYCVQAAALGDLQRWAEAAARFEAALGLDPGCVAAHGGRGLALLRLGRAPEALASFDAALALEPDSAELLNNRGNVLRRLQRLPEALESYERAIALAPGFGAAYNNRGLVLQATRRFDDAAASYRRAIQLQPKFARAYSNLGTVECELGQPAAALASFRHALELQPHLRGVHGNLGNALRDLGRPAAALAEYDLAVAEDMHAAASHLNRGNALYDLARLGDAIASYDRAVALDAHCAQAHFNRSVCLLLAGELAQGWPSYEWRKQLADATAAPLAVPVWHGSEELAGRTLLIYADQALGDTLQFCRYARLVQQRGAQVILSVQPQLRELLSSLDPAIRIVGRGEERGDCDYQCALLSLPLAFATTLAEIPAALPYLSADPQRVALWRRRLGPKGFRVGIAWQGSRHRIDVGRSAPLAMFSRLATVPGVRLICLQKGEGIEQLDSGGPTLERLAGFDDGPQAFLDSAAVMVHLDLVITCDTALAHLAGALGRPTWVALKYVPDWRWLLERADSPWYPGMRLFRQPRPGDWESVFAAIHAELVRYAQRDQ